MNLFHSPVWRMAAGIALFLAASASLAGSLECGARPIRLGFFENGAFYFENPAHQPQGIDKDIIDELAKRSGCKFDSLLMARARIWADLASGDIDMSVSGIANPERERFAWFANYMVLKNYALVNGTASMVRSAKDFLDQPSLQFGVVRGYKHGEEQDLWLSQLRQQGRVQESPDIDAIYKKLKENRVDAIFSPPPVYRKKIQDLGLQTTVSVQDWTPREKGIPLGLILAKSRFGESEAAKWRALIDDMRKDGSLKRIYERYLPPAESAKLLEF